MRRLLSTVALESQGSFGVPVRRNLLPGIQAPPPLPHYMETVYHWAYVDPQKVRLLDNPVVVNAILWGNMDRLTRSALKEVQPGQKVLQPATVYGDELFALAERVSAHGQLDILDVAPIQVDRWQQRLQPYPHVTVYHADAETPLPEKYDVVNCFFLLHEVPDDKKKAIMNNMLRSLKPDGRAVFIDYHRPCWYNPVYPFMSAVNRFLEPFCQSLWDNDLEHWAADAKSFDWTKETYFGGLYQKTVAKPKSAEGVA
eukprot:NODE_937_length_1079_cov_206.048544_g769_i0.p2 GENE.NODE_937_length_1079_cov_206.048544_g769_i0~~NODE_937_length_1079_cov_206.048544_g769_i0.p2  ORF type:complete len:256 (+),score=35.80 NODE_937_length_1079_cov_206.048544_g769_i0:58-825(+)